jgi:hypothetical protein
MFDNTLIAPQRSAGFFRFLTNIKRIAKCSLPARKITQAAQNLLGMTHANGQLSP